MTSATKSTSPDAMRDRFWQAVETAGLSRAQFFKRYLEQRRARARGTGKSVGESMLDACFEEGPIDGNTVALEWLLRACELIHVDVRWVITGEPSSAAVAAIKSFEAVAATLPSSDRDKVTAILRTTPQPQQPGVCCYCGCTDEFGCGDCEWVAACATVCSRCLIVQE